MTSDAEDSHVSRYLARSSLDIILHERFADYLSREWDPGDVHVSHRIFKSIKDQYSLHPEIFSRLPLNYPCPARLKYMSAQLSWFWRDGRASLWNKPFYFLPLVVGKIAAKGGRVNIIAPYWTENPWFTRLKAIATDLYINNPPSNPFQVFASRRKVNEASARHGYDWVSDYWAAVI